VRRAKRMSNGTVVMTEYDAAGRIVRETYYTADEAWVTKIVEGASEQFRPSDES
jgi:YD repeat-containing protein